MTNKELVETASAFLADHQADGREMTGTTFAFVLRKDETLEEHIGDTSDILKKVLQRSFGDLNPLIKMVTCIKRKTDDYWIVSVIPELPIPLWTTTIHPPLPDGGFDPDVGVPGEALLEKINKERQST